MTTAAASTEANRVTHAARAAQFGVVGAALLTIIGLWLAFGWMPATTPVQQLILAVLLWPSLLMNSSTMMGTLLVCFVLQFALLWLLAFAALRYRARHSRHAL
jgi:hypothetical protein